jgi:hypothetical protein
VRGSNGGSKLKLGLDFSNISRKSKSTHIFKSESLSDRIMGSSTKKKKEKQKDFQVSAPSNLHAAPY